MSEDNGTRIVHDVEVTRIPSGERITLPEGTPVVITQALGGSFTLLIPSQAGLYRLEGGHAAAIGREIPKNTETHASTSTEDAVWGQLKTCFDPEIPVNIVDLGLIYSLDVTKNEEGGEVVAVKMTLTAPGCGMGPIIAGEARQKILALPGVAQADVELVWEPAWTPERISPEGKEKLGIS